MGTQSTCVVGTSYTLEFDGRYIITISDCERGEEGERGRGDDGERGPQHLNVYKQRLPLSCPHAACAHSLTFALPTLRDIKK